MAQITPSAGYTLTLRVNIENIPGSLGRLTSAIGRAGGDIGAVDLVEHRGKVMVRDITVKCRDEAHGQSIVRAAGRVQGVEVRQVSDRTFDIHASGKISVTPRFPLKTRDDLSMAYTPGVARISRAIADEPNRVWELTIKQNSVAVLTDGTAVLGLGDVGPEAAMPVMEGKAMLFKEFADIDAYPICARVSTPDELIAVAKAISPGFGGINLEDIAAPACFAVEERLRAELDIPVFHDDQHGTAVVVLGALLNAAKVAGRRLEDMTVVFLGMGAAGVACTKLLLHVGIGDVIGCDRQGIVHTGRGDLNDQKRWIAENTNSQGLTGGVDDALRGADAFVGVSGPNLVKTEWLAGMATDSIVFALANPVPEIMPEEVPPNVRIVATGRSDYPNQINNVLVFPGFFRGLLDSRASGVTIEMEEAAARALSSIVAEAELSEEYIVPSVFDRRVVEAIALAVQKVAADQGLARVGRDD
ncbi:MAG TPA: malic enzyme-like NAD(P)-binding protein [Actinomycetota bacterium]|nr:malic enzyme-like NAD(P)-binding protein [Actinomycetota bacterium]